MVKLVPPGYVIQDRRPILHLLYERSDSALEIYERCYSLMGKKGLKTDDIYLHFPFKDND